MDVRPPTPQTSTGPDPGRSRTREDPYDALLRRSYGTGAPATPPAPPDGATPGPELRADTGTEVLPGPPPAAAPEEYVVDRAPASTAPSTVPPASGPSVPPLAPEPLPPAAPDSATGPAPVPPAAPAAPAAPPSAAAPPVDPGLALPPEPPAAGPTAPGLSQGDLAADMEAILSGRATYQPGVGMVPSGGAAPTAPAGAAPAVASPAAAPHGPPATPAPEPDAGGGLPLPDSPNTQAIFDRIAQSMEHANAFDLGTVELQRRFEDFDRFADLRARQRPPLATPASTAGTPAPAPTVPTATPPVGQAAFVQDLDAIAAQRAALDHGVPAEDFAAVYHLDGPWTGLPGRTAGCGASSLSLTVAPERATAMYDTGEHVLAAGDLYPEGLRVGSGSGVLFSYGQVVAMGDFFASPEQLMAADPAELSRLKALIQRNTDYYRNHRRDPAGDVGNEEWDTATGGRYLDLAEANDDHFSPLALCGLPGSQARSDNRRRWEELHAQALTEKARLDLEHTASTPFPNDPLVVNAFADHFLTDAFAAGHLVNKEFLVGRFRSAFFSGGALNAVGRDFFEHVARLSFTGEVAAQMSRLEPVSYPLCAFGWCLPVRPNIRTAGMFAEVLKQAAVAEPAKIANVAVKTLHDHLNTAGVEVTNDAGDGVWRLTGDGAVNEKSLAIMRRAVQQSVDNLSDPSIRVSQLNPTSLQQRVWRHTPRPTTAGLAEVGRAIATYTDPHGSTLRVASAQLITDQIGSLVKALEKSGRMQRD